MQAILRSPGEMTVELGHTYPLAFLCNATRRLTLPAWLLWLPVLIAGASSLTLSSRCLASASLSPLPDVTACPRLPAATFSRGAAASPLCTPRVAPTGEGDDGLAQGKAQVCSEKASTDIFPLYPLTVWYCCCCFCASAWKLVSLIPPSC